MSHSSLIRNRAGAALFMTLVVSLAVAGIAVGSIMLASGAQLSTKYYAKESAIQSMAVSDTGAVWQHRRSGPRLECTSPGGA